MKPPTLLSLTDAIIKAGIVLDIEASDIMTIVKSIKIGKDAQSHTGSTGCLAYFSTEESIVVSFYYDAPNLHWQFFDEVNKGLDGCYCDHQNNCEHVIYED